MTQDASSQNNAVCPESTIDSAPRRDFIKKAALATAAVAVGGTIIGKGAIPQSNASSSLCCGDFNNTYVFRCLVVDDFGSNDGQFHRKFGCAHVLSFGCEVCCSGFYYNSGRGIASPQVACSSNRYGLTFFTCYEGRMYLTKSGKVGIGTATPHCDVLAQVNGPFLALSTETGAAIHACATGCAKTAVLGSGSACTIPFVAKGTCAQKADLQQWNKVNTIKSVVTSCGWFGIGTCSPLPYALKVIAPNQQGIRLEGPSSCVGAAISFQTINPCVQGWEILDTGKTSSQGPNKLNIRNLTTVKDVFTICGPNSYIGINNTAPGTTLCVVGGIHGKGGAVGVGGTGSCYGVAGFCAPVGVIGSGKTNGVQAFSSVGTALLATVTCKAGIPIIAKGASCQTAPLQEWQNSAGTVKSAVNSCGWLGLGATSAPTTLHVGGSISAKMANTGSKNYCMGATDFAVFACTATVKVTLPAADSAAGRIVFIKNTSLGSVTVAPYSGNCIEGSTSSRTLSKPYDSLMLMSNGSKKWVLMGNSIGDAFVS